MYRKLFSRLREYKRAALMTVLFMVFEVVIECLIPLITSRLLNSLKAGMPVSEIIKTGCLLAGMALLSLACGAVGGQQSARAAAGFSKNLRTDLFSKIQTFSFKNIDKFSTASLVTRLTTDVDTIQMAFMMTLRTAVRSPLMLVFSCVMAFIMGGKLAAVFVITIPLLALGLYGVARAAMPAFHSVFRRYDRLNESIEENVRGMRVVKGFAREEYEKEKFAGAAGSICMDFTRAERIVALNMPFMTICMYINMLFILYMGSKLAVSTGGAEINVGQIAALLSYGMQTLMSMLMLSMIYVMMTMSMEAMKRVTEVLEEEPTVRTPEKPVREMKDGSIVFEDVNLKYSEDAQKYALFDIDLSIASGMTVGVIGGTGSSKTSLVQLIPRLYDVSTGSVRVGGRDVRDYDLKTLRDNVAMVLQKNEIFSGTIKDNLRWGNPDATEEEMREACRLAQADEFISTFDNGYDTYIEQGGTNLSGGQKQRLCIARALLKKPKVLILDDSTSAVDTKTDALIRSGFRRFIPETTKIIIAQRIASVQDADLIVVMENGCISATGTHGELMKTSEIYRETYEQQNRKGGNENE